MFVRPGRYSLTLDSSGRYVWGLVDAAGRRLLSGGPHATKAEALAAIEACRVTSPRADHYAQARDKNGSAFFVLRDPDGTVIGWSDALPSEAHFERAILAVRAHGLGGVLEDRT